jgi:Fe-S cluster biogenesis protein NfuA/nitrite reductase/ring-hydroxylating ferredoxin subunit
MAILEPVSSEPHPSAETSGALDRAGLRTFMRMVLDQPGGEALLRRAAEDPLVHDLFSRHGLMRSSITAKARAALGTISPALERHGGEAELLNVDNGHAIVRVAGACNGCSMASTTLPALIHDALVGHNGSGVAEITSVEIVTDSTVRSGNTLTAMGVERAATLGWARGPDQHSVGYGARQLLTLTNATGDSRSFVLANTSGQMAVFDNQCPEHPSGLGADPASDAIMCKSHKCRYDPTTGIGLPADETTRLTTATALVRHPTRLDGGHLWVHAFDSPDHTPLDDA